MAIGEVYLHERSIKGYDKGAKLQKKIKKKSIFKNPEARIFS